MMVLRSHRRSLTAIFGIVAVIAALYLPGRALLATYELGRARRALATLETMSQATTPDRAAIEAAAAAAVRSARRAIRFGPEQVEAHLLLAEVYVKLGSLGTSGAALAALSEMEVAAKLKPALFSSDPTTAFHLGVLRYEAKNYVGASESFRLALALDPNYADARYFLGLSLKELGETAAALSELHQVAKLNPTDTRLKQLIKTLENK